MAIESIAILVTLVVGVALGATIAWLASRTSTAALETEREVLRTELEKDRAVHTERLKTYAKSADAKVNV